MSPFRKSIWPGLVVALLYVTNGQCQDEKPAAPVRLLIPAYFYPAGSALKDWKRLFEAARTVPLAAIVNPDSGPGKRADANYKDIFSRARNTKLTLLGYVTLSYGKRPISAVKADVDSWLYFYPEVQGLFLDEQPSQPEFAPFALEVFAYVRGRLGNGLMVTNPGVPCAPEYLAGRDAPVACLFEHETGFSSFQIPDWARAKGADFVAMLFYHVKSADLMRTTLADATRKGAGYCYITDAPGPNPWDRLPTYWQQEVDEAARINRARSAPGPTRSP